MIFGIGRLSSPHPERTLSCSGSIAVCKPDSNNNAINVDTSQTAPPNSIDTPIISSNNSLLIVQRTQNVEDEVGEDGYPRLVLKFGEGVGVWLLGKLLKVLLA
jgi:hypothetical protein